MPTGRVGSAGWATDTPGVLTLPDGRLVRGGAGIMATTTPEADLVILLRGRRPDPPTTGEWRWIRWPDFALPTSADDAVRVLTEAHARAADARVLITCGAGVGRTGTALALLAGLSGVPAADAIAHVRRGYHPRAVETAWQARWVERMLGSAR